MRVVITGAGLYTPFGLLAETYAAVRHGATNFTRTPPPDPQWISACTLTAAQARDHARGQAVRTRAMAFARLAFDDCLASAQMDKSFLAAHSEEVGMAWGQLSSNLSYVWSCAEKARSGPPDRFAMMNVLTNVAAGSIALEHGLGGVNIVSGTACAASLSALGEAMHALRRGEARAVFVGGSEEALNPLTLGLARRLGVASAGDELRVCAPFDAQRSGLVLGEGAGWLLLETLASARERGAAIVAEVAGFGSSCGGKNLAAPDEDGLGGFVAMARALLSCEAAIEPGARLAFNAHATGTRVGDASEARGMAAFAKLFARPERLCAGVGGHRLRELFAVLRGEAATAPAAVMALKGSLGHMFSAASVVETALGALALRDQCALPLPFFDQTDVDAPESFLFPREPAPLPHSHLLKNSFGFGGTNASLLLRRFAD